MGAYASATLCFGAKAPDDWTAEDADEKLPADGPLVYVIDGRYDWPEEDQRVILCVKDSARVAHEIGLLLDPESLPWVESWQAVGQRVNAGKLYRHLTGRPFEPQWWLVPAFG